MMGLILGVLLVVAAIVCSFTVKDKQPWYKALLVADIVLAIVCIVMSCVSYVPTGYTGIVTTFGKVHDSTLDAGINFHAPWDNVIKMDNREQRATFQLEAFSKDIQQVDIQGSINYNIDKATAMNLYKDVGTNYVDRMRRIRLKH